MTRFKDQTDQTPYQDPTPELHLGCVMENSLQTNCHVTTGLVHLHLAKRSKSPRLRYMALVTGPSGSSPREVAF